MFLNFNNYPQYNWETTLKFIKPKMLEKHFGFYFMIFTFKKYFVFFYILLYLKKLIFFDFHNFTGLSGAYNVAIVKTVPNKEKVCPQFLFHYFNICFLTSKFILSFLHSNFSYLFLLQDIFPL